MRRTDKDTSESFCYAFNPTAFAFATLAELSRMYEFDTWSIKPSSPRLKSQPEQISFKVCRPNIR